MKETNKIKDYHELFGRMNISAFGNEYETVNFTLGWGATKDMFDNPFLLEKLHQVGLHPQLAFGCALEFLLEPSEALRTTFEQELKVCSPLKLPPPPLTCSFNIGLF
jgi:hypothetical protein